MTRRGTTLDRFRRDRVGHAHIPEGSQRWFRFPNGFGASVIHHTRGDRAGQWEVALLQWDGDDCRAAVTVPGSAGEIPVFYHAAEGPAVRQLAILRESPPPTGVTADVLVVRPSTAPTKQEGGETP